MFQVQASGDEYAVREILLKSLFSKEKAIAEKSGTVDVGGAISREKIRCDKD
jgi:hypothetical protein